jgi:hypothetical protein
MSIGRKWKRSRIIIAVLALSSVALLACWFPVSPEGRYYNKDIGSGGEAYFGFRDGKVYLMIPLQIKASDGLQTNFVGTYAKEEGGWMLTTTDEVRIQLKANLFSIRWIGPKDGQEEKFPRMFSNPN